jgi:hypothetical protein
MWGLILFASIIALLGVALWRMYVRVKPVDRTKHSEPPEMPPDVARHSVSEHPD